jgi:alpha-1,3-rhamnosyltransferase
VSTSTSDVDIRVEKRGVVSVLVPLYNHAKTIERSLASVLLSDCSHIELIVCDDASTDRSFETAVAWIGAHEHHFESTRVLRNPRNLGITGNVNRLVGMAAGEFVTFLGSDDELPARSVDLQRACLQARLDIDFVFANCGTIDSESRRVKGKVVNDRRARMLRRPACATFDIVFNWSLAWTRLFARRAACLRLGPYLSEHSFEDRWCTLKIAQTGRLDYLHEVVYLYRLRPRSGTAGIDQERVLRDLRDVERRAVAESSGLLRSLLQIRVKSAPENGPVARLPWLGVRYAIALSHRLLVGR